MRKGLELSQCVRLPPGADFLDEQTPLGAGADTAISLDERVNRFIARLAAAFAAPSVANNPGDDCFLPSGYLTRRHLMTSLT